MVLAAVAVGTVIWSASVWLLAIADSANAGTDQANARLGAVRTALAAGAGTGAAIGLLLAFRRQHHEEVATTLETYDAEERRITELYTKAVEQLGSDRAAVRLGGLYALERLAQSHASHRQIIVEVLCGYLRMSPDEPAQDADPQATQQAREEQEVRQTAQRILTRHLRRTVRTAPGQLPQPNPQLWEGVDLDLTSATLENWNFHGCTARQAVFIRAHFRGEAFFGEATFTSVAVFGGATFDGHAWFADAMFHGDAWFLDTAFASEATFRGTSFAGQVNLQGAQAHDSQLPHSWPPGWRVDSTHGSGRLIPSTDGQDPG